MTKARDIADRKLDDTNLTFGDNDKAIFGAGSDLQIYHNGSNSIITETGTGHLYLGGDNLLLANGALSSAYLEAISGGAVNIYHNGSSKLATTSTGIDVTGTATMDGLTVDGGSALNGNITINDNTSAISFDSTPLGTNGYKIYANINDSVDGGLSIQDGASNKIALFKSNGDISFYENTGSSPKFFWDASAERLGIGTSSPTTTTLHVQGIAANGSDILHLENDGQTYQRVEFAGTGSVSTARIDASTANGNLILQADPTNVKSGSSMQFEVDGTEAMRIDSSGNVGIGTSSPDASLHVNKDGGTSADVARSAKFESGATNSAPDVLIIDADNSSIRPSLKIKSGAGDIFNVMSDGNVGIGTSSPTDYGKLVVFGDNYDPVTNYGKSDTGIHLRGGSSGAGTYTNGLSFSYGTGSAGISGVQDSSDSDVMGLAFFTHPSPTGASPAYERMRIDSNGTLLVGTTSYPYTAGNSGVMIYDASDWYGRINLGKSLSGSVWGLRCYHNGSGVGGIIYGDTSTSFNTSSDYRLKEDWQPVANASDRVAQLKPVNFAWKASGERVDGFLAHELAEVIPEAVTGEKDAMRTEEYEVSPAVLDDEGNVVTEAVMGTREVPDYQGIDQSKLVPLLTAALQEALTRIETLEAEVSALKGA